MCDEGMKAIFGTTDYMLESIAAGERYVMTREHGNLGSTPWNKLPEYLVFMIRECVETFTWTDPAAPQSSGAVLAKRRWCSDTYVWPPRKLPHRWVRGHNTQ